MVTLWNHIQGGLTEVMSWGTEVYTPVHGETVQAGGWRIEGGIR